MNIGAWIGQREYALECFNEAERLYKDRPENPDYNYDNHFQYLAMMKAWGGMPFQIDWHCVIFQSMNKANTKWLPETKRVWNQSTGTFPPVIHFNGDPSREAYGAMVKEILS
jgi:hypothetical protein